MDSSTSTLCTGHFQKKGSPDSFSSSMAYKIPVFNTNSVYPDQTPRSTLFSNVPYILSTAVAYSCVIAAQYFLNNPHGEINISRPPVPESFYTAVCG